VSATHGIVFQGSQIWIVHRRQRYGPFDYEWSKDFAGIELMFAGRKFGEYCGKDEIFADLKEFRLPSVVTRVATIALGCRIYGVLNGFRECERDRMILGQLCEQGYERFAFVESEPEPPVAERNVPPRK
jgi:hypothetical protein